MNDYDKETFSERNWGAEPWRAPTLAEGDTLIYSEHGRILGRVDYRSHYFRLVRQQYGPTALLVKHGGGEERINLRSCWNNTIEAIGKLDSDDRYLILHQLYRAHSDARRGAAAETADAYRLAFAEGRLKKRKQRGSERIKVWIEPKSTDPFSRAPQTQSEAA